MTVENVLATLDEFMLNADTIFRRGMANAFAKLDRRFRSHDGFKVGARVILTRCFYEYGSWNWSSHKDERSTLIDIERTFTILDGKLDEVRKQDEENETARRLLHQDHRRDRPRPPRHERRTPDGSRDRLFQGPHLQEWQRSPVVHTQGSRRQGQQADRRILRRGAG